MGLLLPALLIAVCGGLLVLTLLATEATSGWRIAWFVVTGLGIAAGLLLVGRILWWLRVPRLAYEDGQLLVYLDSATPTRVPIDIVECFFLGQGASELPKLDGRDAETQNVIVRLAESAKDWRHRDVHPSIGHWCEGYITLSGAWCEPIDGESLKRLNARLVAVHREQRAKAAAGGEGASS